MKIFNHMMKGKKARLLIYGGSFVGTLFGTYVLVTDSMKQKPFKFENPEDEKALTSGRVSKLYVVTGATSGIGKAIAEELADKRQRVVMACRNMDLCEEVRSGIVIETENKYVYCQKCDLESLESVRKFVRRIKEKFPSGIDGGLVHNAGIMEAPYKLTDDGIEHHLAVNFLSPFLLTRLLLQESILQPGSRIVNLLSLDYRTGEVNLKELIPSSFFYSKSKAYKQSLMAKMMWMNHEVENLKKYGITMNAVYPGVCNTKILRYKSIDKSMTGSMISNPLLNMFKHTAEEGATTPLRFLLDPSLEGVTGKLYSHENELSINEVSLDEEFNVKLVKTAEYWTGLKTKDQVTQELASLNKSNIKDIS